MTLAALPRAAWGAVGAAGLAGGLWLGHVVTVRRAVAATRAAVAAAAADSLAALRVVTAGLDRAHRDATAAYQTAQREVDALKARRPRILHDTVRVPLTIVPADAAPDDLMARVWADLDRGSVPGFVRGPDTALVVPKPALDHARQAIATADQALQAARGRAVLADSLLAVTRWQLVQQATQLEAARRPRRRWPIVVGVAAGVGAGYLAWGRR